MSDKYTNGTESDVQTHKGAPKFGDILLELGKIQPADIGRILAKQNASGVLFGEAAKQLGLISDDDINFVLSKQFNYTFVPKDKSSFSEDLVAVIKPFSVQVEGYRSLRSQLMFRWFNDGNKAFSVVSPKSGEGSSYLAANLAVVFAQLGKKTLLIDANLRKPKQHLIFNIQQPVGLVDILANRTKGFDTYLGVDAIPNLSVLSAGTTPPNPLELISRLSFDQIVQEAKNIFDVTIIDTPSLEAGSDAQVISMYAGGAVISSKLNQSSVKELINLRKSIERTGATVLGIVANES